MGENSAPVSIVSECLHCSKDCQHFLSEFLHQVDYICQQLKYCKMHYSTIMHISKYLICHAIYQADVIPDRQMGQIKS